MYPSIAAVIGGEIERLLRYSNNVPCFSLISGYLSFKLVCRFKNSGRILNSFLGFSGNVVAEVFRKSVMSVLGNILSEGILCVKILFCGEFSGEVAKFFFTSVEVNPAVGVCNQIERVYFYLGIFLLLVSLRIVFSDDTYLIYHRC